jgi:hypothetical protein
MAESLEDGLPFRGRDPVGDQVVVVEAHSVGSELGQTMDGVDGVECGPDHVSERIAAGVADGPEAEGEVVLGARRVGIGHGDSSR